MRGCHATCPTVSGFRHTGFRARLRGLFAPNPADPRASCAAGITRSLQPHVTHCGQPNRMAPVRKMELTLERWTSALLDAVLPPRAKRSDVVSILRRECDEGALIIGRDRILIPNTFIIEVPLRVYQQLACVETDLGNLLAVEVRRHAAESGYIFAGPVAVSLHPSDSQDIERFHVLCRIVPLASPRGAA